MRGGPMPGPPKGSFDEGFTGMATVEKMPMLQMGYDKLNAQLRELKAERPLIVDAIEEARAHGDLSENAEYHAAKERQGQVEATINDLEDKLPYYAERHMVKPGITGWAQINYPYGASIEDARHKLEYDLYYAKNYTPFLDLLILLQTARVIIWPHGAR